MDQEPFVLPPDFNGEVPLFPLPNLVMFPFNVQPLHIFESRYREMFEDALAGDCLLAMATLEPGYEADYPSRPPVAPFVCIGRVTDHQRRDDGTYDLFLAAVARARIEQEIMPVRSYRRARVTLLKQENVISPLDTLLRGQELTTGLAAKFPAMELLAREFMNGNVRFSALTDIIAFHYPFDTQFKLTLLGEPCAWRRSEMLKSALQEVFDSPQPPFDISSN